MIYRLTYCNKDGVEARLDIIRGASTPVEIIEGTANPFLLSYKMDKPDKSGFFMTSSADISIFETPTFNIDELKTSSETEIKVEHYINNVLDWSGFVIPDFFSKTIGTPATVEMVASDRLGTLKGVTLGELNQYESMRDLAVKCLAKTGLALPLYTLADFGNAGQTNAFFKALGLAGRLSDTKGRNISCYDILKSILVASNSKLVQQGGAWYIVNKFQHEQGAGSLFSTLTASTAYSEQTVNFSNVQIGARRTIIPVGATTGVFHEFGGGRIYPDNFDFRDGQTGWTTVGAFVATITSREITGYNFGPTGATIELGDPTDKNYLLNKNVFNIANYIQSADIDVPYDTGRIEVVLDINSTGPRMAQAIAAANLRVSVGATDGSQTLWLNTSGIFQTGSVIVHNLYFPKGVVGPETANFSVKGVLEQPSGYNVFVRIYGSDEAVLDKRETAINFATISFNNTIESPKGLIYRRNQGTGFTKKHDLDTSIFGDYMRKGLDGYFYEYPLDDTSSLYSSSGTLTEPLWTAHGDAEQLPLLRHVTRQKSRMFSIAHNMISARIDVVTFKPLSIFVDCNSVNPRHVVVSASYDFLRSEVEVELEQIAYTTLDVREYIYSYFGEGEGGISSVGGISGGGTGTGGGGMTPEQIELLNTVAGYWTLDENGNLKTTYNAYSEQELSAYGFGGSGGGGGGGSLVTWSNETTEKVTLTVEGIAKDLSKSGHTHAIANITGLQTQLNAKALNTININAGTGLTGGGNLTANRTLSLSATTIGQIAEGVQAKADIDGLEIGGRNYFSINDFVADNKARGYSTINVINYNGNIAYRSTNIANNHNIPRYLQGKFEANTQYYLQFKINWESYTDSGAQYVFQIRYTDGTTSNLAATTSQTSRSMLTASGKTIDYITTTRQYDGTVVIYEVQIEKSNKASDWKPAPEDQISDWNTTDITSFSYIKNKPTQLSQFIDNIGIVNLTTNQTITGEKTFNANITLGINKYIKGTDNYTGVWNVDNLLWRFGSGSVGSVANIRSEKVGIGTDNPLYKLDVSGTGRFTGDLTAPKVIFSAAGWSMVQTGTELQMQYNGVAKMRFLNGGSIVAVQEITAYS